MERKESQVNIYYEKFEYTSISQVAKISPVNLFGNIGGIIGLLLGASIISIIDSIEQLFIILYMAVQHFYFLKIRSIIAYITVKNMNSLKIDKKT